MWNNLSSATLPPIRKGYSRPDMPIDSFTVLLFGLVIKLVLGALFVVFWLKNRSALWFGWWSVCLLLGCVASLLYAIFGANSPISIGIGIAALIASFACCWQGARAFDRRRPLWSPIVLGPSLWLGMSLLPSFATNVPFRTVLSSGLIAPFLFMSAVEFWRGRAERLPSRWPVIAIFGVFAALFASRIALIDVAPFPFGALPMEPQWLGAFNLAMFSHTILLSVLLVSLSKERLELDQRTKAQTDPLTGALNRRAFMLRGERLLQRHAYEKAQLCLVFLDIDQFKAFNDRFGHSGGDDVLVSFVSLVNACIRPTDFMFRIGGEEFCCLLPYTTTDQAYRVAERIRFQFEQTMMEVSGTLVRATASLGIASTDAFGYDLEVLMRRADMAVYAAKRAGRNRVVVANATD
jgi:diguanylate cyclase (GGDEF)-like protein